MWDADICWQDLPFDWTLNLPSLVHEPLLERYALGFQPARSILQQSWADDPLPRHLDLEDFGAFGSAELMPTNYSRYSKTKISAHPDIAHTVDWGVFQLGSVGFLRDPRVCFPTPQWRNMSPEPKPAAVISKTIQPPVVSSIFGNKSRQRSIHEICWNIT